MITSLKPPLPHEHGAWAMWSVPLIIGTWVAPQVAPRVAVLWIASLAFFLLRYPLATLVKTRRRPAADRARWLSWSIGYGLIAGLCGLWLVAAHRLFLLIPIGLLGGLLIVLNLWLVARKQDMSSAGELIGIFGLALGAPLAYYVAGGQLAATALLLWIVNGLYFGGTVFYIKLKVRQQPRLPAPDRLSDRLVKARACLTYQAVVLTLIIALVALDHRPLLLPLAFVPMTLKVIYGAARWQDRRTLSLPRLGVIEIVHSIAFAVLVIAAF
jgi:hypothetical protein